MINSGDTGYTPLDELMERPGTRVLVALRRFDWVAPHELFDAAGFPDYDDPQHTSERRSAASALSRLVRDGFAERHPRRLDRTLHRITAAGRVELERLLTGIGRLSLRKTRRKAA